MKRSLGYTQTAEVNIVRRKHTVGFRIGTRKCDLIASLASVPDEAVVDEVLDEAYSETNAEEGDGVITIEFHEEALKA